jgi:hypothetical protein
LDASTWILTPGEWITRTWAGLSPGAPESPWAAVAGFLFWAALLVVLAFAWSHRRTVARWMQGQGQRQISLPADMTRAGHTLAVQAQLLARRTVSWLAAWSWPVAWSVLWRAQAVHLILYAALPLAILIVKATLVVALLPFSVMGFGDSSGPALGAVQTLKRPVCWTFLSYCPSPAATFGVYDPPAPEACRPGDPCGKRVVVYRDPGKAYFKVAWLVLVAGWLLKWRRRRTPRRAGTRSATSTESRRTR